jgi:hypothetical protein
MNEQNPKLLTEIRSLKYGIVFSASVVAFAISQNEPRGNLASVIAVLTGFLSLVAGLSKRYQKRQK